MKSYFGKEVTINGRKFFRVDPDFRGMLIIILIFTIIVFGVGRRTLANDLVGKIKLPNLNQVRQIAAVCNDDDAMLKDIILNKGVIALKCYERELQRLEGGEPQVARR